MHVLDTFYRDNPVGVETLGRKERNIRIGIGRQVQFTEYAVFFLKSIELLILIARCQHLINFLNTNIDLVI